MDRREDAEIFHIEYKFVLFKLSFLPYTTGWEARCWTEKWFLDSNYKLFSFLFCVTYRIAISTDRHMDVKNLTAAY